jgi:hypothetical protein
VRTVTFSDARVAEVVNANFVPVWLNRGKGFHNCELGTEEWIFRDTADAYPTKNICTFLVGPDRRVLFYFSGYYAPDLLLDILKSVEKLKDARDDATFKRLQRELATRAAPSMSAWHPFAYHDLRHEHDEKCTRPVKEACAYLKRVHESLAQSGPPSLEVVRHDYLSGNSFTEEAAKDAGFAAPRPPR